MIQTAEHTNTSKPLRELPSVLRLSARPPPAPGRRASASGRHSSQYEAVRVRRKFSSAVRSNALLRAKESCEACGSRQQLELHHVGHRRDASLFNYLVLCARCHQAEHARRRNARPAWEK